MRRYWEILKKYKGSLMASPLLVLAGVLCETVQPYLMSKVVDDGVMRGEMDVILRIGATMVGVSAAGLLASVANVYVSTRTSTSFGADLRSALFGKIGKLAFADIDRFGTASLITRLTNDITRMQQVVMMGMRIMLRAPFMLVMAIFFVIKIDAGLAVIFFATIPVLGISVWLVLKKGFPFFLKVQRKIDALNGVVRENLINIRVVKSFVREDFETEKFTRSSEELRDIEVRSSNIIVSMFPAMQLVLNISLIAILWFGGVRVTGGRLQLGELISFVNYLMQVLMAFMMMLHVIMVFARASASMRRVAEVLDTEPSLSNTDEGLRGRNRIERGDVEFRNVGFSYGEGGNDVLRDISFKVAHGETVAVVGATGSAKSSLVQLIPRLYDATEGEVLIDGVDVRDYDLAYLRSRVGIVLQNNELFTGTIVDNLRWGNPGATMEQIEEAAKAARAHDFITSFAEGYDTALGRSGVNISGGQKQRLCIARALLREPRVLILDDSLSAVDTDTELKIRDHLRERLKGTTVLIITQRISTMQSADRIVLLDDGGISAIGKPGELMERSELYREIHNSQQLII